MLGFRCPHSVLVRESSVYPSNSLLSLVSTSISSNKAAQASSVRHTFGAHLLMQCVKEE